MSARLPSNASLSAPQAVPVLCPSPRLDLPPLNPGTTVGYHRGLLVDGVSPVLPDGRVPTTLVQCSVRGRGAAVSAARAVTYVNTPLLVPKVSMKGVRYLLVPVTVSAIFMTG